MGTSTLVSGMAAEVSHTLLSLSLDGTVLIGVVLVFFLFALLLRKSKSIALLFSLYIGGTTTLFFPYWGFFNEKNIIAPAYIKTLALFLVIFVTTIILRKVIFSRFPLGFFPKLSQTFFLGICNAELTLFFAYKIIPLSEFYAFKEPFSFILDSPVWFFWGLVLPLLGLYFMERDEFV